MKTALLGVFCILFLQISVQAQSCGSGNATFRTQFDVDQLKNSNCSFFEGNVEINSYLSNNPIKDLSPFLRIKRIDGNLSFFNNPTLTSLSGLDSIKIVGERISISDIGISSLAGLGKLKRTQYIYLSEAPNLTSLAGLVSLDSLYALLVTGIPIVDATGFAPELDSIGTFSFKDMPTMQSLSGLGSKMVHMNTLEVVNSKVFNSIGQLPASLTSIGSIRLQKLPLLASVIGFENLAKPMFSLYIRDCPLIKSPEGIGPVPSISSLISDSFEDLNGLDAVESIFSLGLDGPLKNFLGLKSIKQLGGVYLTDNPILSFEGLEMVDSLRDLEIRNCTISNFSGLDNITYIYSVRIASSIVGSMTGLEKLERVSDGLQFLNVSGLTNLQGLSSLRSIEDVYLWLYGTYALQMENMPDLVSLDGLNSLETLTGLYLAGNNKLQNLAGVANVDPTKLKMVHLRNSIVLDDCNVKSICNYLLQPTNAASVGSNGAGCKSREQILSSEECLVVFPVELISFTGESVPEGNKLSWRTASETTNKGFEIERSGDAKTFSKIGFVEGNGNSNQEQQYTFTDSSPLPVSYYRLKQLDFDGKFDYSKIIILNTGGQTVKVYPNPARGQLYIESVNQNQPYSIRNVQGFSVMESSVLPAKPVDTSSLQNGLYLITVGKDVFKVAIQN